MKKQGSGWHGQSRRHSLARKGIKTANVPLRQQLVARGMNEEQYREYIRREIEDFQRSYCPYGYLDIEQAILHADAYGYKSTDLQEWLDQFFDDVGMDRNDVDITALAYEEVLQIVRGIIDNEIGFDIMNDGDFYTYGNYMASSYDYSQEGYDALIDAIKNADPESREELLSNDKVTQWLYEVDINVKEFKASGKLYTKRELASMPTLHTGHFDDLKVDKGDLRVWLSRMTVEDGMPYNNQVTVERKINGEWVEVDQYQG